MAAIRDTLELDIDDALRQVDRLRDQIEQPLVVDVDVEATGLDQAENSVEDLRQELERTEDATDQVGDEARRAGREFEDAGEKGEKAFRGLSGAAKGFLAIAGTAFAVDKLIDFGKGAVTAASDLAESTGKANVVFGEFAKGIFAFTEDAPRALRLSTQAAVEMAGTFGNLFIALGLSQKAAADLAPEIVQLGADLGSFNNIEVGEVLEKLRSGLVGEAEPLRTLGVNLTAATTSAKVMELGLVGVNGEITEAAKVQARWALILEQTATAQGDAARTADEVAGKQATLAAEFANVQATIGEALIPAYEILLDLAPLVLDAIEDLAPALAVAAEGVADFFDAAEGGGFSVAEGFTAVTSGLATTADLFGAVGDVAFGVFDLLTLRFEGLGGQVDDFGDRLSRVAERDSLQGLVAQIAKGTDKFDALANSIAELESSRLGGTDALVDNFELFAAVAGVTGEELLKFQGFMLANPALFNLNATSIAFLTTAHQKLNAELLIAAALADTQPRRVPGRRAAEEIASDALTVSEALDVARGGVELFGGSFTELAGNLPDDAEAAAAALRLIPPEILALADTQMALDSFVEAFDAAAVSLSDGVDVFSEVPDKLKTTKEQFLKNLTVTAAEQAAFESNLIKLAIVAPALAATLQDQGVAARGLVDDFLADSFDAQRANSILSGAASDVTGIYTDEIVSAVESSDLDAAGILALEQFLEGFASPEVIAAGVAALQDELNRQLRGIQTPYSALPIAAPGGGRRAAAIFEQSQAANVEFNLEINHPETPDLATDITRAQQTLGAIPGLLGGP